MRGLSVFISDIRRCTNRTEEDQAVKKELAKILEKFNSGVISGYDRKKYICKLLFAYMLDYNIDFGSNQVIELTQSHKPSEKTIGCLATIMLSSSNEKLIPKVLPSINQDIESKSDLPSCLAIHTLSSLNLTDVSSNLLNKLLSIVADERNSTFVRKKAILCLLSYYRESPQNYNVVKCATLLINVILNSRNYGLLNCALSFALEICVKQPSLFEVCVSTLIDLLYKIVIEKEYDPSYSYYKVIAPWFQIKIIKMLQYLPVKNKKKDLQKLNDVMQFVIKKPTEHPKNIQHTNAHNSVLTELILLASTFGQERNLSSLISLVLQKFISSKEPNLRYLGLECMINLSSNETLLLQIKEQQETIIISLRDKDINIVNRAVDLLINICDYRNAKVIIIELLKSLSINIIEKKHDLIIKMAIVMEKFATDPKWYLEQTLKLIYVSAESYIEDIYCRVIQIITNNINVHKYAAELVFNALEKYENFHQTLNKLCVYVLGEFGHLICQQEKYTAENQFELVYKKFCLENYKNRATYMNTFLKFYKHHKPIRSRIMEVFDKNRKSINFEVQQRASEYFSMCSMNDEDIINVVCETLPEYEVIKPVLFEKISRTSSNIASFIDDSSANDSIEIKNISPKQKTPLLSEETLNRSSPLLNVSNSEKLFNMALSFNEGLLFEDGFSEISFQLECMKNACVLDIYVGNKSNTPITEAMIYTAQKAHPFLKILSKKGLSKTIKPNQQTSCQYELTCTGIIDETPLMRLTYVQRNAQSILFKLPIHISRFIEPVEINRDEFFVRWEHLGEEYYEKSGLFRSSINIDTSAAKETIKRLGYQILENIDPNLENIIGAGILNTDSRIGILIRIEPNMAEQNYAVTIRSTDESAPEEVFKLLSKTLSILV